MDPDLPERQEEPETLMRMDHRALAAVFTGYTLAGVGIGVWLLPPDWSLLMRVAMGVALGFGAALILYANRILAS